ncbi:MAG: hypothetical protein WC663_06215 [Patescibacteria group bacterium]
MLGKRFPVWVGVYDKTAKIYEIFRIVRGEKQVGIRIKLEMSIDEQNNEILCQGENISMHLHSFHEFKLSENLEALVARQKNEIVSWIRRRIL